MVDFSILENINYKRLNDIAEKDIDEIRDFDKSMLIHTGALNFNYAIKTKKLGNVQHIITRLVSEQKLKKVVLDFYKTLSPQMFTQALQILTGNSPVKIAIYDKENYRTLKEIDDTMPTYTNSGYHTTRQDDILLPNREKHFSGIGAGKIFIPRKGNIQDYYMLAHEIAHTFDAPLGLKREAEARRMLGELTPSVIENMLDDYLLKNQIITERELINRRKEKNYNIKIDAYTNLLRMGLAKLKSRNGSINKKNLIEFIQEQDIDFNNPATQMVYRSLLNRNKPINYDSRYVIAEFLMPVVYNSYRKQPQETISNLENNFFEYMKKDDFYGALQSLGIDLNNMDNLIEQRNEYINDIENREQKLNDREGR